uniref:CCHC-type domain-containing protein n=1 Tax=Fundulus heteroclitus TaxID=8078 RepID=A0A3Q2QU49_FUNHE
MEQKLDRRIGVASAVKRALYRSVVVNRELSQKANLSDLPVDLCYYPHLWSRALGRDRENEIPDTSGQNEVRQLKAELQENTPAQNAASVRNERAGWRFPQRTKSSTLAPPVSTVPVETLTRTGKFCYNCGEDSHMLPQCTNPTNAVLVQKKLCERHQSRLNQCKMHPNAQIKH